MPGGVGPVGSGLDPSDGLGFAPQAAEAVDGEEKGDVRTEPIAGGREKGGSEGGGGGGAKWRNGGMEKRRDGE